MRASRRQGEPARRESVPVQEESGQRVGIDKVGRRGRRLGIAQKAGKPHQLVLVRLSSTARNRAARARRNESQIGGRASRRTGCEVKPKAKLGQEIEL